MDVPRVLVDLWQWQKASDLRFRVPHAGRLRDKPHRSTPRPAVPPHSTSKGCSRVAYAAKDITVLKGLEPVRKRPGHVHRHHRISGLHHLVYEVVDNSVDEAMAGLRDPHRRHAARRRRVPGVRQRPRHPGRPPPRGPQEVARSRSCSRCCTPAGKFGGEGYKISGGLHGVGVSVVNALSTRLELEVHRDGGKWTMAFENGGKPHRARSSRQGATRSAPGRSSRSGPTRRCSTRRRVPGPDPDRAPAGDRVPQQGPRDPLQGRAHRPGHGADSSRPSGGIVDFVKHLNASRSRLQARRVLRGAVERRPRSRSRCSGTPATTRASTRSPTTSTRTRAACTRRASRRPSRTW